MAKINPFKPNSTVPPGMFVGRLQEIKRIEQCLLQTRSGNPTSFMILGERGIGKSSLLNYVKWLAKGEISLNDLKLSFLVVDTDIEPATTQIGLVQKIEMGLRRTLKDVEGVRQWWEQAWSFLQRLEVAGAKLRDGAETNLMETAAEEFSYALADVVNRVCRCDRGDAGRGDGVLIMIDEADNGPECLRLGSFLKLLVERLERRGCNRVMVGLAGLPDLRRILYTSHASSLRLFQEVTIDRLSNEEVSQVIDTCLDKANRDNEVQTSIDEEGRRTLISISEGYPHFIQQFGFSAFAADIDNVIDKNDVVTSAYGKNGALTLICDRYYRVDFYEKIKNESYREVLRIMSENLDQWVTKKDIKSKFTGSDTVLTNAIKALRDRHIIISKEGERGTYRLQNRAFALWVYFFTTPPKELEQKLSSFSQT